MDPWLFFCPKSKGLLEVVVEPPYKPSRALWASRSPGVWRYWELLPTPQKGSLVSLGEGWTPLLELGNLARLLGVRLYGKYEGCNPTGSFKDRGMTVATTIAKALGARAVVVASTGNTAASASAYAARAGLKSFVLVPSGGVARGKLVQAIAYGAIVVEVEGFFDDALRAVLDVVGETRVLYPLNSFNPWRLEGQKTLAFEVVEQLGWRAPDWVVVPVGNAGNIYAIWKGFKELYTHGLVDSLPRMVGVQAEGASPLVRTWRRGARRLLEVDEPSTIASAIRIGKPVNWPKALHAIEESGGLLVEVSDEEIVNAMTLLARLEGLAVEPASAASLAGAMKLVGQGVLGRGDVVVLVLTGHGLKDPDALAMLEAKKYSASTREAARLLLELARNTI